MYSYWTADIMTDAYHSVTFYHDYLLQGFISRVCQVAVH